MPTVHDILTAKGENVIHKISATTTVLDATQKMNHHKIGALVVTHDDRIVGIFTERDVLRRVVAEQKNPAQITVGNVMTREVICAPPQTDLEEVMTIMKNKRIRHLPVCDEEGQLLGLVSIGDVNAFNTTNQEATIHFLNDYIYGRV
ncbi:MAG TPA: CBS domain-containing protein [Tepidisphaeraceae bacterium]